MNVARYYGAFIKKMHEGQDDQLWVSGYTTIEGFLFTFFTYHLNMNFRLLRSDAYWPLPFLSLQSDRISSFQCLELQGLWTLLTKVGGQCHLPQDQWGNAQLLDYRQLNYFLDVQLIDYWQFAYEKWISCDGESLPVKVVYFYAAFSINVVVFS